MLAQSQSSRSPPQYHSKPLGAPNNLRQPNGDAFNIDPDASYLGVTGDDTLQGQVSPPVGRDFVGGFVGGMKRVFRGNRPSQSNSPEEGIVIITTNPEPSPPQMPAAQTHPMLPTRPPSVSVSRRSNFTADGDVHHEPLPEPLPMGSPVFVEPEPGSDYAKMDSPTPTPSTASLASYLSRVRKFFQELNDLPWVASERVTVDYYPSRSQRAARRRSTVHARSPLPPPPQRPVISWYDTNNPAHQGLVDLFSSSSSPSTVMAEVQIQGAQPLPKNARVVYPAVYGPVTPLRPNQYPNSLPAPAPAPMSYRATVRTESSSSSRDGEESFNRPMYPHGYVSYQQHGAAGAQYAGDTIHHMTQPAHSPVYSVPPHT